MEIILTLRIAWVQDKVRSKFAFEALCWEKNYIPEDIWKAGESDSNLIEGVHSDVNREGIHCTLVGGIMKGQAYDSAKMKTLLVSLQLPASFASDNLNTFTGA